MPKVTILIPIYNCEKYLKKCIESALNQSLKGIEIIIINDGSFDSSSEIIESYKNSENVKIINKANSGYGASLNLGIKEAKGEYISIFEADDFADKDMLKKLFKFRGHDVIKSGFYFYPDKKIYCLNIDKTTTIDDNPEIINIKPSVWSAIYKKEFLILNNIFFNETKGASFQDVSFHFKTLFCAKDIVFIDEPLYYYRTDNENASTKSKSNVNAIINEFSTIDKFIENKPVLPETNAQLVLFELRAYIWNFKRIAKQYENEYILNISDKFKEKDLTYFYKSLFIPFKEKIKMWLLLNDTKYFKFFLSIIKKYAKR